MIILKEKKVLELYDSGKSTRDIAKILRMSLRDISFILKNGEVNHGLVIIDNGNSNNNNKSSNEKSTQAYRLFEEGKKPVEVAIQLCLSENEATRYYKEYWKLKRLYKLHQLYTEVEHCLPIFLKLHSALKRRGLTSGNVEWFANAIETGAIKQHIYTIFYGCLHVVITWAVIPDEVVKMGFKWKWNGWVKQVYPFGKVVNTSLCEF